MIKIINKNKLEAYLFFYKLLEDANNQKQDPINAICISSFNRNDNEVNSRLVNLRYLDDEEWTFFSNYKSQKAEDFIDHQQISALFFWPMINVQIRMKAKISISPDEFSDKHFRERSISKNILAISSKQSQKISSYDDVVKNYKEIQESNLDKTKRPKYWGGYTFKPYYFEFWEGHNSRLNKRLIFEYTRGNWHKYYLQP